MSANLAVYLDPDCKVTAYMITTSICTTTTEVGLFCSNSQVSVVNCQPLKWEILNETTVGNLNTITLSTECLPFASGREDRNFKLYANQKCQANGWTPIHQGSIGEVSSSGGGSNSPSLESKSTSTSLYVIIGIFTSYSGIVLAVVIFLVPLLLFTWYTCIRRASRFRRKPVIEEGLVALSDKKDPNLEPISIKVLYRINDKALPLLGESNLTLEQQQTSFLKDEDTISAISFQQPWQTPTVLPDITPPVDPLPRPSMDPYKATPHFLPRESTDSFLFDSHFTSKPLPGLQLTTQCIHQWNTELVSSHRFVSAYSSLISLLTLDFRLLLTLPRLELAKDIQKSYERGLVIMTCLGMIVDVKLEGTDRDLVYKTLVEDPKWESVKNDIVNRLVVQWKVNQDGVDKLNEFVDKVIEFYWIKVAVDGGLVCSTGEEFDPLRHTFEEGSGNVAYCLIPGLVRGDQVVFREIVSNCPLVQISDSSEQSVV